MPMRLEEKISLHNAKYLLSLPPDEFKRLIWINDNFDNGENTYWKPDTYIARCKSWLRKMIIYDGKYTITYKHSNTLQHCGRLYGDGFSVQSLQKQLRGFLTSEYYNDYDMSNCHPTILLYLVKKFFPTEKRDMLTLYVIQRKLLIAKYKLDKQVAFYCINDKKSIINNNQFILKLDKECKNFQQLFFNKLPEELKQYEVFKYNNKRNPEGGFLNTLLTIYENNILNEVIQSFDSKFVSTLMFDGLHLDKSLNIKNTIKQLNEITKKYGIFWTHKKPDMTISIDDGIEINEDEFCKDYDSMKKIFEEENFMIKSPLIYGREYEQEGTKKTAYYNKGDFKDVNAHYNCDIIEEGKIREKEFFSLWLKDKSKRSYTSIDFIPKARYSKTIYNTFNGFAFQEFDEKTNIIDIQPFIDHLGVLTNNEKQSIDYLINYIAHLIQKPYELPAICLVFKSGQGYGKDLLINFIEKMLGSEYVGRTAEIEDVFGNFTTILRNNLVLQVNELQGKDGFLNKEKFKNLITQENVKINDKYEKAYQQTNYSRLIICSNNLTPIEIPSDDRRFVVFEAQVDKPNTEYFKKLVKCYNDDQFIYSLYQYFKKKNINRFDIRNDRPITKAYNNIKDQCVHPFYEYLDEFVAEGYYSKVRGIMINKNNPNNVRINSTHLLDDYKRFMHQRDDKVTINYNAIKAMFNKLGVEQIQKQINNKKTRLYNIYISDLITNLKKIGVFSEVLEDEDDDFEILE
jgi:putative DNA primase/helicase